MYLAVSILPQRGHLICAFLFFTTNVRLKGSPSSLPSCSDISSLILFAFATRKMASCNSYRSSVSKSIYPNLYASLDVLVIVPSSHSRRSSIILSAIWRISAFEYFPLILLPTFQTQLHQCQNIKQLIFNTIIISGCTVEFTTTAHDS